MSTDTKEKEASDGIIQVAVLIFIVIPACMFMYQLYLYLQNGEWSSFSVIDLLIYFGNKWAIYPDNWLGFWKVLGLVNPAYLIPAIVGIFLATLIIVATIVQ